MDDQQSKTANMEARGRTSLRLQGYDYSQTGAYFVTLVSSKREFVFGDVIGGQVELSAYGNIANEEWFASKIIRREIELFSDEFVVMPNHIHGIVWIHDYQIPSRDEGEYLPRMVRATAQPPLRQLKDMKPGPRPKSLGSFIVGYKTSVTKRINRLRSTPGNSVWMRNYQDRIIRDHNELAAIRKYIQENPFKWALDRHYSE